MAQAVSNSTVSHSFTQDGDGVGGDGRDSGEGSGSAVPGDDGQQDQPPSEFTQGGGGGGSDGLDSAHAIFSLEQRNAIISESAMHGFCSWKHWKLVPWKKLLRGENKADFGVLVFSDHEHFTEATPLVMPLISERFKDSLPSINLFNLAFMMLVKDGVIYRATDNKILDTMRVNGIHTEMADSLQRAITRSRNNDERSLKSAKSTSRSRKALTVKYKDCDPIPADHISAELYLSVLQEKRRRIGELQAVEYLNTGRGVGPLEAVEYVEVGSGNPSGNDWGGADSDDKDDDVQSEEVKAGGDATDDAEFPEGDRSGGGAATSDKKRQGEQELEQEARPAKKSRLSQNVSKLSAWSNVGTRTTAELAEQMERTVAPLGPESTIGHSSPTAQMAQETSEVAHEATSKADMAMVGGGTTDA